MNMCNHILLVMDSSIWIRVSFSVDNAPKNIFRHTKIAAHVVYILTSNNPVAYAFLSGNDFDRVWQVPNIIEQIVDAKRTFTVKTILNVIRVAATVVWALGIKAGGIWVAFCLFKRHEPHCICQCLKENMHTKSRSYYNERL